jgi:hypothetical protein
VSEWINEWMNAWMKEWMHEWMKEGRNKEHNLGTILERRILLFYKQIWILQFIYSCRCNFVAKLADAGKHEKTGGRSLFLLLLNENGNIQIKGSFKILELNKPVLESVPSFS